MNKKKETQLGNLFSEDFLEIWKLWKEYKWASHKFKYRSIFSEQAAIEQLFTLSKGDEEVATKIIKQSMRREWQGLFPLHETTTGDGKSKKSNTKESGAKHTESAVKEFMRRNGNGGQESSSDHLKAV